MSIYVRTMACSRCLFLFDHKLAIHLLKNILLKPLVLTSVILILLGENGFILFGEINRLLLWVVERILRMFTRTRRMFWFTIANWICVVIYLNLRWISLLFKRILLSFIRLLVIVIKGGGLNTCFKHSSVIHPNKLRRHFSVNDASNSKDSCRSETLCPAVGSTHVIWIINMHMLCLLCRVQWRKHILVSNCRLKNWMSSLSFFFMVAWLVNKPELRLWHPSLIFKICDLVSFHRTV